MVRPKAGPSGLTPARAWVKLTSSRYLKSKKEIVNYKGETGGVPLFTSPTLNISGIEVEYRGFRGV